MRRKARVTGSTSTKSKRDAVGGDRAFLQCTHQRGFAERGAKAKWYGHLQPPPVIARSAARKQSPHDGDCFVAALLAMTGVADHRRLHRRIDIGTVVLAELGDLLRRRGCIGTAFRGEPSAHQPVQLHRHLAQLHQIGDAVQDRHPGGLVNVGLRQQRHHHAARRDHHLRPRLGIRPRRAIELRDDPLARGRIVERDAEIGQPLHLHAVHRRQPITAGRSAARSPRCAG